MTSAEKKRWLVVLVGPARKSLKRLPPSDQIRIRSAIGEMEDNPFHGDIRKLKGDRQGFRRRVGEWRVFFDVYPDERRVVVTGIERRASTTY
jgi:mRNA-degrading endonuclease RelE of RelBE toxin-antitoxin system